MFCYIWEYEVLEDRVEDFLAGYGPEGEWVRFFRRDPEYVRTELLRDCDRPARFLTVDHWTSREARDAFRARHHDDWDAIDRRFEAITRFERLVGEFESGRTGRPRNL